MYENEVAKGSAWLDKVRPGWHKEIDVETLNLGRPEACTLGQTFGRLASENLCQDGNFSIPHGFGLIFKMPLRKGFLGFGTVEDRGTLAAQKVKAYRILSATWIQEILRRRANDRLQAESLEKTKRSNPVQS